MRESWENLKTEPTSQKLLLSHLFRDLFLFRLVRQKQTHWRKNSTQPCKQAVLTSSPPRLA